MARFTVSELHDRCRSETVVSDDFWQRAADAGGGAFGYGDDIVHEQTKLVCVGDVLVVGEWTFDVVAAKKHESGGYTHWIALRDDGSDD
ncbi:hypothetical protein C482_11717 [Natrialba chahannaoensis JCM 10990]|uniref:Uncharacterized protein n=1 Tax=Natrialba chahannaoensis JCM 10990 TaxID=1227492 RepID=M0AIM0_9EURY|nr:hypothetical protein [Natrialba chahannaoensis]ELY98515.1 hypothetical protein C482_11717 [Natrialba chahannaoensis JCM 10990]